MSRGRKKTKQRFVSRPTSLRLGNPNIFVIKVHQSQKEIPTENHPLYFLRKKLVERKSSCTEEKNSASRACVQPIGKSTALQIPIKKGLPVYVTTGSLLSRKLQHQIIPFALSLSLLLLDPSLIFNLLEKVI